MSGKDPAVMRLELARMHWALGERAEAVGAIERAARALPDPDALLALVDACLEELEAGDAVDLAARLAGLRARSRRSTRASPPICRRRSRPDPGEALRRAGSLGKGARGDRQPAAPESRRPPGARAAGVDRGQPPAPHATRASSPSSSAGSEISRAASKETPSHDLPRDPTDLGGAHAGRPGRCRDGRRRGRDRRVREGRRRVDLSAIAVEFGRIFTSPRRCRRRSTARATGSWRSCCWLPAATSFCSAGSTRTASWCSRSSRPASWARRAGWRAACCRRSGKRSD